MAIAQAAVESGRTVREVAGERTDLPAATLDELLDPITLSRRLGQTCRERPTKPEARQAASQTAN